ncbi:MAG TPA: M12 family metallo-peptidase [Armatimonadota bacterium]
MRERWVSIRRDVLKPGAVVRLNLFPDAACAVTIDHSTPHPATGCDSFSGHTVDDPLGCFALVTRGEAVEGLVMRQGLALYRIATAPGGFAVVQQVDGAALPPCGTSAQEAPAPPAGLGRAVSRKRSGGSSEREGPVIDVLVVYTPEARAAAGGQEAIEAKAQLSIDLTNQAYANSLIDASVHLVHTQEVAYQESGGFNAMLRALTDPNDGQMDAVHQWRNEWGADMVSLLVKDYSYCGMAWVMTSLSDGFAGSAFSVCNYSCVSSGYTMAHELGHNEGCDHDRDNAVGRLYPYSYGWRFMGNSGQQFRTVMSYAPGESIPFFSNPAVTFDGQATGVAIGQADQSDNADTVNSSAATAAAWRSSTTPPEIVDAGVSVASAAGQPANGVIQPGQAAIVSFALRNVGSSDAANVTATLLEGGGVVPLDTAQSYGAMVSGSAPVSRAFSLVALGPCGGLAIATLKLSDGALDLGVVSFPLRLGASTVVSNTIWSSAPALPIPDKTTVEQTITVPYTSLVDQLRVGVRLDHGFDRDLEITLIAPDGTSVDLSSGNGGAGKNYGSGAADCTGNYTVFDDAAPSSIQNAAAPFVGSFRPEQPLSSFTGLSSAGVWTLRVADVAAGDSGVLYCWRLEMDRRIYACGDGSLTLNDAANALRFAGGLGTPTAADLTRLSPASPLDTVAAVHIARKVLGLDGG